MPDIARLHYFPGTCAQVTASALEHVGLPFGLALMDLRSKEARANYAAVNPRGKVPALELEGRVLTENAAILWYLHQRFPQSSLMPVADDAITACRHLADLLWCSSTLHPMVRQVRMPTLWTQGDPAQVYADGEAKLAKEAERLSAKFGAEGWWYGAEWSIVDTYLWWGFRNAERGGFNLEAFPLMLRHAQRVEGLPSTRRALAREADLGLGPGPTRK